MRFQSYVGLATLASVVAFSVTACISTKQSCEELGLEPGCESATGGASSSTSTGQGGSSVSSTGGRSGNSGGGISVGGATGGNAAGGTTSAGTSSSLGGMATGGTGTGGGNSSMGTSTALGGIGTGGLATGGVGTGGMATGGAATGGATTGGMATGGLATGGAGTGGFVSACNPTCSSTKPMCKESAATCVECLENGNCPASRPACNLATNICVGCMLDNYCSAPTPACNLATDTCVGCMSNANCSSPTPACNTGSNLCVQCTKDTYCSGATPACNTTTNTCVECTGNANCTGATSLCDTAKNTCVECLSSNDCKSPTASLCSSGTCSPCASNSDCSHLTGKGICKTTSLLDGDAGIDASADAGASEGECVQCTVEDESPCNGKSCNPATNTCTTTTKNSIDVCLSCVADSECIDNSAASAHPSARCVEMTFKGAAHGTGGYCLQRVSAGCSSPYSASFTATSLSGAASEAYCGINQNATTCEAVLDLIHSKACTADTDCGGSQGGLCKAISVVPPANRCTIPCGSSDQCTDGKSCSPPTTPWCH